MQFIVTICSNGPLCVAELVHGLLYALRQELYVTSRYVFIYIYINLWAGHVARMGEDSGVHRVLVGKPEGKAIGETKT